MSDVSKAMADALADDVEAFLETVEVPTSGYGYTMWSKLRRTLQSYRAQAEVPKYKSAAENTAEAVRAYLEECSRSERWPDQEKVYAIFRDNFAPILNHRRPITLDAR